MSFDAQAVTDREKTGPCPAFISFTENGELAKGKIQAWDQNFTKVDHMYSPILVPR